MSKTTKRIMACLLAASLTVFAAGLALAAPDPASFKDLKAVELIGADTASKGAVGSVFGELVAKKVDEYTGGKLTIDYHPNGDLGGDEDLLRQMQSNDIQIVVCQTAPIVPFIPEMAVFDLPMVFSKYDGDIIDKVLNNEDSAFRKALDGVYEKAGYHYLGIIQNSTYRLTTANKDLKTLADFKGLKIRTMSNSNHMAFWTAIGAEPTPLAFGELYFALQSGTVNGEENAADTILNGNFYEVQSTLACTNHILYANQICINKEAYDDLDPKYQAVLSEAVKDAIAEIRPEISNIDTGAKKTMIEKGINMIEYDEAFFNELLALDAVKAVYTDINGQTNNLGTILIDTLEATK